MNIPLNIHSPVEIQISTHSDFIENLPGTKISKTLLHAIEDKIYCIEQERKRMQNNNVYSNELVMLEEYQIQVFQSIYG